MTDIVIINHIKKLNQVKAMENKEKDKRTSAQPPEEFTGIKIKKAKKHRTQNDSCNVTLFIKAPEIGIKINIPKEPAAVAIPNTVDLFFADTTFEIAPKITTYVVALKASPIINPRFKCKSQVLDIELSEKSPKI